jgi:hypothetical protein
MTRWRGEDLVVGSKIPCKGSSDKKFDQEVWKKAEETKPAHERRRRLPPTQVT